MTQTKAGFTPRHFGRADWRKGYRSARTAAQNFGDDDSGKNDAVADRDRLEIDGGFGWLAALLKNEGLAGTGV